VFCPLWCQQDTGIAGRLMASQGQLGLPQSMVLTVENIV
jgi:hypothetical protein